EALLREKDRLVDRDAVCRRAKPVRRVVQREPEDQRREPEVLRARPAAQRVRGRLRELAVLSASRGEPARAGSPRRRTRRSVANDRADALPFVHEIEGLVDVLEAHLVRDEGIDLDLAAHVLLDHARQPGASLHAAERAAAPRASRDELDRPRADLLTRAATPMIVGSPHPLWQHSSAARIGLTLPTASNE